MNQSSLSGGWLSPVTVDQLFNEYWESDPLHIDRSAEHYFSQLLSVSDIETALCCHEFSFPSVQLTQAGKTLAVAGYTDESNRIVLPRLQQLHQDGATIVMSGAQKVFPTLAQLCRTAQKDLQMRCQANVYLSPPGRQGFNAHFDSHDVFIVQVSGRKTFRFYEGGVVLPFTEHSFDAEEFDVGELVEEIQLAAGDTLYIPRGLIHDAVADEHESSLHITLGVYAITSRQLLQEMVQLASEKEVNLRRSIHHHMARPESPANQSLLDQTEQLLGSVFSVENYMLALERLRDDLALDTAPDNDGWLSGTRHQTIDSSTVIKIRGSQLLNSEKNADGIVVRMAGKTVQFDKAMVAAIEQLVLATEIVVSDLPELACDQQVALANRLYRENMIDIAATGDRKAIE